MATPRQGRRQGKNMGQMPASSLPPLAASPDEELAPSRVGRHHGARQRGHGAGDHAAVARQSAVLARGEDVAVAAAVGHVRLWYGSGGEWWARSFLKTPAGACIRDQKKGKTSPPPHITYRAGDGARGREVGTAWSKRVDDRLRQHDGRGWRWLRRVDGDLQAGGGWRRRRAEATRPRAVATLHTVDRVCWWMSCAPLKSSRNS